jgi:Schlafen, AlbA_2
MLFSKPPESVNDIRAFCQRFSEGIRVEYKSAFDQNVRNNMAKMVSAFANSLGGVAIIGVVANNGVPQPPIEGFDDPGQELTLAVEQICLQGINPSVIPRITVIPSDVGGKCFLVIEVDESPEAPHAIENQTRVYVRTGNAANPYELAKVHLIIERFTRRSELQKARTLQMQRQLERSNEVLPVGITTLAVEIGVGPLYPRRALVSRESVWHFADTQHYRGGRFIPGAVLRRTNDGVAGFNDRGHEYVDLSQYGFVFWKRIVQANQTGQFWRFIDVFHPVLKSLICSSRYFAAIGYRGDARIDVTLHDCFQKAMPFLPGQVSFDEFRSVERNVTADADFSAETLDDRLEDVTSDIFVQLCWSFWQPAEPFPELPLRDYVLQVMREMGRR